MLHVVCGHVRAMEIIIFKISNSRVPQHQFFKLIVGGGGGGGQQGSKALATRIRFHRKPYMVFNENAMIVLHLHIVFVSFILFSLETVFRSYHFQSFSCRVCSVNFEPSTESS